MKGNCSTCSNRVGEDFCTMKEDMKLAMFKQCSGFTIAIKKESKMFEEMSYEEILKSKQRRLMMSNAEMEDSNFGSDFIKFIKTGGHWSLNVKKVVKVN